MWKYVCSSDIRTQVKTVYTESPAASPTLRSPLQTTLESSSRSEINDVNEVQSFIILSSVL